MNLKVRIKQGRGNRFRWSWVNPDTGKAVCLGTGSYSTYDEARIASTEVVQSDVEFDQPEIEFKDLPWWKRWLSGR